MRITRCIPELALPGGVIRLKLEDVPSLGEMQVKVGELEAEILGASSRFVTVRIPDASSGEILLQSGGETARNEIRLGRVLTNELHPVANPVVDEAGYLYVTYSGARGEEVPFSVFRVSPEGEVEPFLGDIVNPTGLAIGPDDHLYITSRHTGAVYRSSFDKQLEKFADGLGIASGLAFDSRGDLFVGDRSGFVYRIGPGGDTSLFCELEPSVSAYHLVFDAEDNLYVSGPTLATQDVIYRVRPDGQVEEYVKGFGRPQGLTFGPDGSLLVVGSYRGFKGVYRVVDGKVSELEVAAPMLVGLAYSPDGQNLYLVDGQSLFNIRLGS